MKKFVALLLVLCLVLPQAAFANETAVPKFSYSDTNTHWGKKHIAKLALLGITSGYDDGTFRPEVKLTQEQAVTMLINMMGLQGEVDSETEAVLPFEISGWAKPYVVLALSKRLISMQEEIQGVTSGGQTSAWGTQPASREWVTKLIIRAIGQEAGASNQESQSTGFSDEGQITSGYKGYINLAKSLNIVSGNTDGTFNPLGTVTRAQMAVFIGNAEKYLTKRSSRIAAGTVLSIDSGSVTLQTAAGAITLSISSQAGIYDTTNSAIGISNIANGDYLYVIQYNNTAYHLEKSDSGSAPTPTPTEQFETITGILENISQVSQTIVLTIDGEVKSYPFAANTTITSVNGTGLSLSSLVPGSTLELKRVAGDATNPITSIVVRQLTELKTVTGTVERILSGTNLVEVKDTATSEKAIYELLSTTVITSGTRELTGVSDLHVGDEVTVSLKDGVVTAFTVTKSAVTAIEGKVFTVDAGIRNINLFGENNTTMGYFVESDAIVQITGMNAADLGDVQKDDEVIIELNANNKVQKIIVKNRSIEAKLQTEFFDFDEVSNTLLFREDSKTLVTKEILADTVIEFNGMAITRDQIKTSFTKGRKIDLVFSGDRIVRMSNSWKYSGKVTDILPLTNTIKINSDEYGSMSFSYNAAPFVELFGKSSTSLADVRIGDQVQLTLDSAQSKVQSIQITQRRLFKVTSKLSYKLTVADENGTSFDINNVTSAAVSHYDKLFATYNDITAGSYVMVTLNGTTPSSIYIPKVSYGNVDSVESARNTFNYSEFGSASRTISSNTTVILNGTTQSTVSGLAAGDRILLVEGKDGLRLIQKLTKLEKKLISYNATAHSVDFYRATLTETNRYALDANVFIHRGADKLTTAALVKDVSLNAYLYNNVIMEIELK